MLESLVVPELLSVLQLRVEDHPLDEAILVLLQYGRLPAVVEDDWVLQHLVDQQAHVAVRHQGGRLVHGGRPQTAVLLRAGHEHGDSGGGRGGRGCVRRGRLETRQPEGWGDRHGGPQKHQQGAWGLDRLTHSWGMWPGPPGSGRGRGRLGNDSLTGRKQHVLSYSYTAPCGSPLSAGKALCERSSII